MPLVEEVHMHLQEMLDSGTICPSQSVWCNAMVLVQKEDRGLCFCIDFWCLNAHAQRKTLIHCLGSKEALESLVGAGHFSCLDLKSGFWQIKMDESSKQYTAFTHWQPRHLWVQWPHAFWAVQCPSHFPVGNAKFPRGDESDILPHLPTHDIVIFLHTAEEHLHCLCMFIFDWFREVSLKLKPSKCIFFQRGNQLFGTSSLKGWSGT